MAAIPRLASTIVLMDKESRVYLTKRPKTMKFLGGFYVFPGGAVEEADDFQDSKYIKTTGRNDSFSQSHYIAAVRELFEEVGILLCQTDEGSTVLMEEETKTNYRRQLVSGDISFLQMLEKEEIYLDLESLHYFGHIITPEVSPKRFDTRFFLAQLPQGQTPNPDLNEIDEALWLSPADALSASRAKRITLALPTIHTLMSVRDFLDGRTSTMPSLY